MFEAEQIDELKKMFPEIKQCQENGHIYFYIPDYTLPEGCKPQKANLLFCPTERDGYNSRLFFSEKITTSKPLNWNANCVRILESNWYAFSWRIAPNMRLAQMFAAHIGGLFHAAS
jgi:hypothetical protein